MVAPGQEESKRLAMPYTAYWNTSASREATTLVCHCRARRQRNRCRLIRMDLDDGQAPRCCDGVCRTTSNPRIRVRRRAQLRFRPRTARHGIRAVLPAWRWQLLPGPPNDRPPLIVESHGGPHGAALPQLSLEILYWTSRGFGVVDVNYGGSTGFGRPYRERLNGNWGIVDTQDCIAAARYLASIGEVDGDRLAIRGASAGGYTTLCALVFHDDFAAGACILGWRIAKHWPPIRTSLNRATWMG